MCYSHHKTPAERWQNTLGPATEQMANYQGRGAVAPPLFKGKQNPPKLRQSGITRNSNAQCAQDLLGR